jgi:non-canonical (house-cleaning) NTP pyrophosphatase
MQNEHRNAAVVTSLNEAKMAAVRNVIKDFFPEITQVIGVASQSMVSETPIGDEEAIAGCRNRIPFARRAYPDAAFFVSIEGAIDFNSHGAFVEKSSSLSELTKATYETSANVSNLGTNGVITNGAFTRTDEFETALRCAFGFLANAQNYR